jgi:hypothetical protein
MNGKTLLAVAVAGLTAACSSVSTTNDYDQSYDFSKLHNYAWAEIAGQKQQADQLAIQRVMTSTDQILASKGFAKTAPGQASFLVALQTGTQEQHEYTTYGTGGWRFAGMTTTTEQTYDEGTLVLDILDAQKKQLIWRGSANGVLDPGASVQKKTENVQEAVSKILADFPPK